MISKRLEWLDTARGLCIVLVVLLHSSTYTETILGPNIWGEVSSGLSYLRLPLFFLISGFLISPTIATGVAKVLSKSLNLYVIYVMWSVLIASRVYLDADPSDAPGADAMLAILYSPGPYWYLWALPVYFLAASLIRWASPRPCTVLLLGSAALSCFSAEIGGAVSRVLVLPPNGNLWAQPFHYVFWFALGVASYRLAEVLPAAGRIALGTRKPSANLLLPSVLGFAAVYALASREGISWFGGCCISAVMIGCAIAIIRVFSGSPVNAGLARLGRATLPIYVLHQLVIFAVVIVLGKAGTNLQGQELAGLLLPIVIAAGSLAASLVIYRGMKLVKIDALLSGTLLPRITLNARSVRLRSGRGVP